MLSEYEHTSVLDVSLRNNAIKGTVKSIGLGAMGYFTTLPELKLVQCWEKILSVMDMAAALPVCRSGS